MKRANEENNVLGCVGAQRNKHKTGQRAFNTSKGNKGSFQIQSDWYFKGGYDAVLSGIVETQKH